MFNIFKSNKGKQDFAALDKLKQDKKALADYQAVFNREKDKKAESGKVEAGLTPGNNESNANGIQDSAGFNLNKWRAQKVLKTNLMQDEGIAFFDKSKLAQILIINILSACLLIAVIYGGLFFWESSVKQQADIISGDISDKKREIAGLENDLKNAEQLEKKVKLASSLLVNHVYWTNFFEFLENNTLANVYYSKAFSGDINGKYDFSATADSFAAVTDQINAFKESKYVQEISVTSAALADTAKSSSQNENTANQAVGFKMGLVLNKNIFLKSQEKAP